MTRRKDVRRGVVILSACVAGFLLCMSTFGIGGQMQPEGTTKPPADLIHWLRSILDDDVAGWKVLSSQFPWFEKGLVIGVTDGKGQSVMLLTDGTNVVRTNCENGLPHINKMLESYAFPEDGFQNQPDIEVFLTEIVYLYYGRGGMITTRRYLENLERTPAALAQWRHGNTTDPNEFRRIWINPQMELVGSKWTATFNRIKPDGSVDQWLVSGRFHQANQGMEIVSIKVTGLKEKGFVHYPIIPQW